MIYKILELSGDIENINNLFNEIGFHGWDILTTKSKYAYFVKTECPIIYIVLKNKIYDADYITQITDLGVGGWIPILTKNGYSVFKKIAIE